MDNSILKEIRRIIHIFFIMELSILVRPVVEIVKKVNAAMEKYPHKFQRKKNGPISSKFRKTTIISRIFISLGHGASIRYAYTHMSLHYHAMLFYRKFCIAILFDTHSICVPSLI